MRLLPNDEFLTQIASFVQAQTMTTITDKRRVYAFGSPSVATGAKKGTVVAANADLVHEAPARTCSEI